jgi:hypothetical protein
LPRRSRGERASLSVGTKKISSFCMYGSERFIASARTGVIDMALQMQSISPRLRVSSLVAQSIGCLTSFTPMRLQTSCATSTSKPTISPDSSMKPMGGNSTSRPMMNRPELSIFCRESSRADGFFCAPLLQPAARIASAAAVKNASSFLNANTSMERPPAIPHISGNARRAAERAVNIRNR